MNKRSRLTALVLYFLFSFVLFILLHADYTLPRVVDYISSYSLLNRFYVQFYDLVSDSILLPHLNWARVNYPIVMKKEQGDDHTLSLRKRERNYSPTE